MYDLHANQTILRYLCSTSHDKLILGTWPITQYREILKNAIHYKYNIKISIVRNYSNLNLKKNLA